MLRLSIKHRNDPTGTSNQLTMSLTSFLSTIWNRRDSNPRPFGHKSSLHTLSSVIILHLTKNLKLFLTPFEMKPNGLLS